jgi:hypothetical protein
VRVAIAETAGLAPGDVTIGQLVTGLRQLGFDYVFGEWPARAVEPRSALCYSAWVIPVSLAHATCCCL